MTREQCRQVARLYAASIIYHNSFPWVENFSDVTMDDMEAIQNELKTIIEDLKPENTTVRNKLSKCIDDIKKLSYNDEIFIKPEDQPHIDYGSMSEGS